MKYISYYRVSTDRQGRSGLGLEAQRAAVQAFAAGKEICSEFTEVESGKKADRPALMQAIAACREQGATLLIAKLDRLSRNLQFITELQASGVRFVCADMPDANDMTIHIIAAIAQDERERISQRTKAALQAKKARGEKLGNPEIAEVAKKGRPAALQARREKSQATNSEVAALVRSFRKYNLNDNQIAAELNAVGKKTARGSVFRAETVKRLRVSFEIS